MSISIKECCVEQMYEPVVLLDVMEEDGQRHWREEKLKQHSDVLKYLDSPDHQNYSCRLISICQETSWDPLSITQPILSLILSRHGFSQNISDLISCFYYRGSDSEDAYCVPFTASDSATWTEIQYSFRYPESKGPDQWALRQTGVCHRINTRTKQSIILLLNPTPNSKGHNLLYRHLTHSAISGGASMSAHVALLNGYLPAWRQFNAFQEKSFTPIHNFTFASSLKRDLFVGYDQLTAVLVILARVITSTSLLASTSDLIDEMKDFFSTHPHLFGDLDESAKLVSGADNLRRRCAAGRRVAGYLEERIKSSSTLLAQTLSLKDQEIAKEQNGNMLQLNKSAVFITMLSLVYAPASFVASFFGMNFFAMDQENSRIVGTAMVWIYVLCTGILTSFTVMIYFWLIQHDKVLSWKGRLEVKAQPKWLTRWRMKKEPSVELRNLSV